jgi:hypothetical protein
MRTPHVIYNRHPLYVIGPLGYWKVGDDINLPDGRRLIVGSLDPDGGACAWDHETLDRLAFDQDSDIKDLLKQRASVRSSYPMSFATPAQQEQVKRIAAHGERERERDDEDEQKAA